MAKITRNKLPRGVKLTIDHVYTPLQSVETLLQGNVDTDNIRDNQASFRLNFNIPFIRTLAKQASDDDRFNYKGAQCIPFVLPPLQEFFNQDQIVGKNLEVPVLEEFAFGFDQRSESTSIVGPDAYNQTANQKIGTNSDLAGRMWFSEVGEKYGIEFVILEKNRVFSTLSPYTPDTDFTNIFANTQEVYNLDIPGTAFVSAIEKLNPFHIFDIGRPFNPYKSYILIVNPKNNYIPAAFVSMTVSLKFKMKIMERDSGNNIGNIPEYWEGEIQDADPVGILVPAADGQIEADSGTGVQTQIQKVDLPIAEGLRGGYNIWSHAPPQEHLKTSAAYEVIAVPMFGGMPPIILGERAPAPGSVYTGNYADYLPYIKNQHAGATNKYPTFDRRIIPLVYPMTIHHVVLGTFTHPDTITTDGDDWDIEVGVGLGTGMGGDLYTYQQVAHLDMQNSDTQGRRIDFFDGWKTATYYDSTAATPDYQSDDGRCDLINIPLVYSAVDATTQGTSYKTSNVASQYLTGQPIFAGRGYSQTSARIDISQTVGDTSSPIASKTKGAEQWLEVRLKIAPDSVDWSGTTNAKPLFYGTFWVYIIGKKHLTKVDI